MNRITLPALLAGGLLAIFFSSTGRAATRVSAWSAANAYSGSASAYPSFWSENFEAADDLILGRTPSAITGNFAPWGNTNLEAINDGILEEIPGTNADVGMFAGVGGSAGMALVFDFDQPMYVSSISYFGGWTDGGRGSVGLTVSYSTDSGSSWTPLLDELNGGTFTILDSGQSPIAGNENLATTFSRKMLGGGTPAANAFPLSNYVDIYDDTYIYLGANAAITNVKFEFGAVYNGWVGAEELSVTGVPVAVPEPAAWALVLSAGVSMGFIARRRRRSAQAKPFPMKSDLMKKIPLPLIQAIPVMVASLLIASNLRAAESQLAAPVRLQCEDLADPEGVDSVNPRLSWINVAADEGSRGLKQSAYRIVVASTAEKLAAGEGDLWDTGKVDSETSFQIPYAGTALVSQQPCFWKVQVWDGAGNASPWSEPARWSMGLLNPSDWKGQWIGLDRVSTFFGNASWIWQAGENYASAPAATRWFSKEIVIPAGIGIFSATMTVAADNRFVLYVNGDQVLSGDSWMNPSTADITSRMHAGRNVIMVSATNDAAGYAGLVAEITVKLRNGTVRKFVTDGAWLSKASAPADRGVAGSPSTGWAAAGVNGPFNMAPWSRSEMLPARYLRREFAVGKPVKRATAYVCGLGFFDLFLNGNEVSDHVMDAALSDYAKTAYYVTFDVTDQVAQGSNALGVVLGNGRYYPPHGVGPVYGFPKLRMQLEIEYKDGTRETIASDPKWKLTDRGPIRDNDEYDGEEYDARMEMPGWASAGFDDSKWLPARAVPAPAGKLEAQMIEPMRVTQTLKPIAITNPKPGVYEVNFGQAFYGTVRLKAAGPRGQTVKIVGAYSLLPDGTLKTADNRTAKCTDLYTFKGEGVETWTARFKGQGLRRIEVTGFPGTPMLDNFEGLVIHTDVEDRGAFECSNELINKIHLAMRWGMRMFLRSAPLDPDRDERQPWTGDPAKDAESEAFNFNVAPFYAKWMDDVRRSQRANGTLPDVSMYWTGGSGVEWPSVFTIIPEWMERFYADDRIVEKNYDAMKKWVLAMRGHEEPDGTLRATSYGDWCDASTLDKNNSPQQVDKGATPLNLISTAYQYNNCRIMERLAGKLGKTDDEAQFAQLADALKTAYNARFLNLETNTYEGDTQCGYILSLQFGLVPEERRAAVIQNFVDNILVKNNGHTSVGLIGNQWIMQTLTDIGRPDVAWTIATQTTRPGWGYMITNGATTIWERWDANTRDPGMNSEALLIQAGNVDAWFYQTLAGVNPDPAERAFKRINFKPTVLGDLTEVKCHFISPYGRIESHWRRTGTSFDLEVKVPVTSTATVRLPAPEGMEVTDGGRPADQADGVTFLRREGGFAEYEIGSGTYHFHVDASASGSASAAQRVAPGLSETLVPTPDVADSPDESEADSPVARTEWARPQPSTGNFAVGKTRFGRNARVIHRETGSQLVKGTLKDKDRIWRLSGFVNGQQVPIRFISEGTLRRRGTWIMTVRPAKQSLKIAVRVVNGRGTVSTHTYRFKDLPAMNSGAGMQLSSR